tara:strand:+ start:3572 stop:4138 length:567 start_codon:yes stop_codon:yes gene_type:complete
MFESDEELHQRLFYIRVDADGEMIEPTYIDPQNIYYIMDSSWDFTLEEVMAKGFAPVLESNATFTNGDNIIETSFGDIVKDADTGVFTQEWVHAEISNWEKRQRFVERTRTNLLFQSDWTQVVDSPLSDADKATWATYRQALRDLPANIDYSTLTKSEDITWPLLPGTELPVVAKEDEDGHVPVDQPL